METPENETPAVAPDDTEDTEDVTTPAQEQSPAEQRKAETQVESASQRVAQTVQKEAQSAEKPVQQAEQTVEQKIDDEARKIASNTALTYAQARDILIMNADAAVERLHAAHGGANPSPPVQAAVTGAASGAAGSVAQH